MKKFLLIFIISNVIFAQGDFEFLRFASKDSIVRADFIQTKQIKSIQKPLVCDGKVLVVKDKGVIWMQQNPVYSKNIIYFNQNFPRFESELTQNEKEWFLKLTPKSAVIKRNLKYITIKSSTDNKFQEVLIFSADESFVQINLTSEIPTPQVLSKEEEALFEE